MLLKSLFSFPKIRMEINRVLAGSRGMQKMDSRTRAHSVYMDANGRKYYAEGEEEK